MSHFFVSPSKTRLRVMRDGLAMIRAWKIPKPVVLVDSREQMPLYLFEDHPNWFGGEQRVTLNAGDYSLEGMGDILSLERKSMADAICSTIAGRERFIRSCARLAKFRWKAILIEASYEDMKTPYHQFEDLQTEAHPNAVCGTLDAIEAKFGIPILYSSRNRDLASEKAASWLSKHFMYWWLEQNGHDRVLIDTDGL
jgi:ERCC4-type nuclease